MNWKNHFIAFVLISTANAQLPKVVIDAEPVPKNLDGFHPLFHFDPVNQDTTSSCWSFATLSFFETEMQRLGKTPVKLSVMYAVYCAFLEKSERFVESKGETRFAPGDLFSTVLEVVEKYGIVPESAYSGNSRKNTHYNHRALYAQLNTYMQKTKAASVWDKEIVLTQVREILNEHLGEPPEKFTFAGKEYTPQEFRDEVVALRWEDYISITSFEYAPFGTFIELRVPDNWTHNAQYFNLPLHRFYTGMVQSVQKGYSVAIDGDFSEPGRMAENDICIIPEFDIPSAYINQDAREFRFKTEMTTDDHLMHIVGYQKIEGQDWFLVKDSWRDAFEGNFKGYFFMRGDYVKLKILAYLVHRDAVDDLIQK